MDRYAILRDNDLQFAPQNKDNVSNYNLNVDLMIADGYKLYVEGTKEPGKKYHESFEETEDEIRKVYTEYTPEEYAIEYRQEKDRLILTPSDVERALYYGLQMDFDDLKALVAVVAPTVDLKGLSIEFRANNFYRGATDKDGNRIVDMIGLLLGLDATDLDYLFEHKELSPEAIEKAYNHLHPQQEPVEPDPEEPVEPEPDPETTDEEEEPDPDEPVEEE